LWNSGMFVWKVSVILESFRRFLPRLYNKLMELEPYIDTSQEEEVLARIYPQLPDISIDYGILERSDDVVVVPSKFGWNDVGSWDALGAIFPPDEQGNIVRGQHVGLNTRDCVIFGNGRLIATINVKDLIIVETPDALLVCPKANAQDVKKIVERLKENPEWQKYL
jgi:mannose-1-phosphate guanylyltransferase